MKCTIFINGRFLTRPLAGVQRTAFEMVLAIDDLLDKKVIDNEHFSFTLLYSGEIINAIDLKHIKIKKKGFFSGNLWEQFELPVYTYGHLLLSMCSISPILKTKQIVIVHDASTFVNKEFFSRPFRSWYNFAIPLMAKISRQIVTVSDFSKNELSLHGKLMGDKITVIYNGADHISRFNGPGTDFKNKINDLKPYCLAVSSLGANKNYKGLSEALQKINATKYNMLIAGGEVSTLAYAAPATGVTYLGYVSNEELKFLYENAALFIFPSFYEGFGIPPLEAMMSGCPVIASETSSIPEILGNACMYFDPFNVQDMADKIQALLKDPEKLELLKERGYQKAKEYRWELSGKGLFNLIEQYSG